MFRLQHVSKEGYLVSTCCKTLNKCRRLSGRSLSPSLVWQQDRLVISHCLSQLLTHLGAENQPLEFCRKQSMRLCGCSNGKWLVQLEVILVTFALCWSAPENCWWEIPHGAVRSVEMTLPFCPHAGKAKVIATSLINENPKGDWGFFCFLFFLLSTCVFLSVSRLWMGFSILLKRWW